MTDNNPIRSAALVKPSKRQMLWQAMEFYAFVHFSINTYKDREWGLGDEDPSIFNPVDFNPDQWTEACKSAGMKGLILTCKHHDGFCLWPSKHTDHSVKKSPWKNGQGDIVREVADACRRAGLKFGIYLSPWDRHEPTYGNSPEYNRYYKNQLRELLADYGEIFCVWMDGACGQGPGGSVQIYDWEGYYKVIRELQPNAVISICGSDVRWCGNEAGHCRKSEWSVVPASLRDNEKIQAKSQKADDGEFARRINTEDEDLGSREAIKNVSDLVWYPAEVNTSIRPGWFYHASEDDKVKSLDELLSVYYHSVGGNACFLLNIPPDTRGLFHDNDVARLKELGNAIKETFSVNLAAEAVAHATECRDERHGASNLLSQDREAFWCPKEGTERAQIIFDLKEEKSFDKVVMMEHIEAGQRVEAFKLEYMDDSGWREFCKDTVIGYKRICRFDKVSSRFIRLTITESRWCPELVFVGIY